MRIIFLLLILLTFPAILTAQTGYIEVTAPGNHQLRLAVTSPHSRDAAPVVTAAKEMSDVLTFDMNMSGAVIAETREQLPLPGGIALIDSNFGSWMAGEFDLLVSSEYSVKGDNLTVEFRLYDVPNRRMMTARRYLGKTRDLRRFAHSFSDEILLAITGEKGCFTTRIAFVTTQTGNKEIAVMDWDGHNMQQITKNRSINLNPDFSPDGHEIIFTSYKHGNPDLYKRLLSSSAEVSLSKFEGLNITGAWSPDGSKIALSLSKDGDAEIYTISKYGKNPMRLTVNPAIEVSPTWSPDGKQIAFVSDRLGKPQIFIMNADGSNVHRLTTTGSYNVNPRWSPKGDKIAYARMQNNGFQIYTINIDGSSDFELSNTGSNENPAWSPDGRFITFSSKLVGGEAICVMRSDGSGQIRVSKGKGNSSQPTWAMR